MKQNNRFSVRRHRPEIIQPWIKKICFGTAIFLLVCLFHTVAAQNFGVQEDEIVENKKLDSFFCQLYQKGMFNGAVAIRQKGKLILKKGYGNANFWNDDIFTPSTPMEVASVSKQFTAAAVMILEQDKKLKTTDPAQKYLGADFPYSDITIQNLLTHTSGLPDYEKYFRAHWDTTQIVSNTDILAYFKNKKPVLNSRPGEKYHYSNSGYIMLAEIVAQVSGQSLDEFLKDKIFKPAGMVSSGFYSRDSIWVTEGYAPGYMFDIGTCTYVRPEHMPGKNYYYFLSGRLGSGRLSSSVNDLVRWDSILYKNDILGQAVKKEIFQVHLPGKDSSDYGFGWHIGKDNDLGKMVYHTGSWAGNLAYIKRYIDDNSLVIILNNTHDAEYMKEIRSGVEDYLKGNELPTLLEKLEYRLQSDICKLNLTSLEKWYGGIGGQVRESREAMKALEKDYLRKNETDKADIVQHLLTLMKP